MIHGYREKTSRGDGETGRGACAGQSTVRNRRPSPTGHRQARWVLESHQEKTSESQMSSVPPVVLGA